MSLAFRFLTKILLHIYWICKRPVNVTESNSTIIHLEINIVNIDKHFDYGILYFSIFIDNFAL